MPPPLDPTFLKIAWAEAAERLLVALLVSDWLDGDPGGQYGPPFPEMRSAVVAQVTQLIRPADFVHLDYRQVYEAVIDQVRLGRPVTAATLAALLPDNLAGLLEELADISHPIRGKYLGPHHGPILAEVIRGAADKRRLHSALTTALTALYNPARTAADAWAELSRAYQSPAAPPRPKAITSVELYA